ncbi:hypothetical protein [Candidatus Oscillochloris fontis]|uniref:hypothetical protein n=1 Tax=Candidatus Oscillochloris fontis TaxID=2496868 RepID=UPI00101D7182|nr:hypothetical protein [Candidatus Oscillochloris fontis]
MPLIIAGTLPRSWSNIGLGFIGAALVVLWLLQPPGRCLGIRVLPQGADQYPLFVLQPIGPWWRGIVLLLVWGLIPTCIIGWALSALMPLILP